MWGRATSMLVLLAACATKQLEPVRARAELASTRLGVGAPIRIATAWEGTCRSRVKETGSDCHDSILASDCDTTTRTVEGPCKKVPHTVAHRCEPACLRVGETLTTGAPGRWRIVTTLQPSTGTPAVFENVVEIVEPERLRIFCTPSIADADHTIPCHDRAAGAFIVMGFVGGAEYSAHAIRIERTSLAPARVIGELALYEIAAAKEIYDTGSEIETEFPIRVGSAKATLRLAVE